MSFSVVVHFESGRRYRMQHCWRLDWVSSVSVKFDQAQQARILQLKKAYSQP